jgi:putative mycofactocin binding protein MftB
MAVFDAALPYRCSPDVSMRPERFGALAYHHGTRRLTFLKSSSLAEVVRALGEFGSADETIRAVGVPARSQDSYRRALAELAASGMIEPRDGAADRSDVAR